MGTSFALRCTTVMGRDHPHACGDKHRNRRLDNLHRGSSPRVWGQGHEECDDPSLDRIIPTRVGTSNCFFYDDYTLTDHPHACGDKPQAGSRNVVSTGSSPRVWGQDGGFQVEANGFRIIPTRVGTRASQLASDNIV